MVSGKWVIDFNVICLKLIGGIYEVCSKEQDNNNDFLGKTRKFFANSPL